MGAEEQLAELMQNVVHRNIGDLMQHEKELDLKLQQLEPQLEAANKKRSVAKQEFREVRTRIAKWTKRKEGSPKGAAPLRASTSDFEDPLKKESIRIMNTFSEM